MNFKEIKVKTILRKGKKIDSWFLSRYGMNIYRGCTHNCVYCDGRSEKYYVEKNFGSNVSIKVNAIDILKKELSQKINKSSFKNGYIMVGGGVGDSYQVIEKKYEITRKTLQMLYEKNFPVHILTKSTLVERDIDIIKKINEKNRAIVSISFSSTDDYISSIFEPGVPSPTKRLETLKIFKEENIPIGIFLMPVIPFITDKPIIMEDTIKNAKEIDIDFIIFSGMTLREGRQKDFFYDLLEKKYPDLITDYHHIYRGDIWGNAISEYYESIHKTFDLLANKYNIRKRISIKLFNDILDENDLVIVILEHIDYLLKLRGKKSPYGFAAYSISKLDTSLNRMKNNLQNIKGVGRVTEKIIKEILETKESSYLKNLELYN